MSDFSAKRIFDLIVAVLGLIATAPILLAAALLIFVKSPGPVLFSQDRVGFRGRTFRIYKLRTMRIGADQEQEDQVTASHDPRIFPGARWLRKYKLDELPQLFNVLEGSMSVVGPRPTVASDYLKMNESERQRFSVQPGITGLAQISGGTTLPWEDRIELDLRYIQAQSFWFDVRILWKTLRLVASGGAGTHPPGASEWRSR